VVCGLPLRTVSLLAEVESRRQVVQTCLVFSMTYSHPHTIERASALHPREPASSWQGSSLLKRWNTVRWALDSSIRRHEYFVVTAALALVTLFSVLSAARRVFEPDEELVRLTDISGSAAAVWHILKTAPLSVDPPLFHFLVHNSFRLFGPTEFFTRLPAVLAFTVMAFLLYLFVRRYTDVYTGLVVIALCLMCGAFPYAYHARPYTLMLAADSLVLLSLTSALDAGLRSPVCSSESQSR
jgi:hypothetical protein